MTGRFCASTPLREALVHLAQSLTNFLQIPFKNLTTLGCIRVLIKRNNGLFDMTLIAQMQETRTISMDI